jgi:hypothetical protein
MNENDAYESYMEDHMGRKPNKYRCIDCDIDVPAPVWLAHDGKCVQCWKTDYRGLGYRATSSSGNGSHQSGMK